MPNSPLHRLLDLFRATRLVGGYHARVLRKTLQAPRLPSYGVVADPAPAVTVLITNMNNKGPLELTLRTLFACTRYPNFEVWVADNDSVDGSVEVVEALQDVFPIRLIRGPARPQHEWYDYMFAHATTPYWVGLHEDLIFLGADWLADLVGFMESERDVDLLGGEFFPPREGSAEPVHGEIVDLQESLSTWIFCVRTALRDRIDTSFAYHKYWDAENERTVLYDQGGRLIEDMRAKGLGFAHMPSWYKMKWQHLANITWIFNHETNGPYLAYKRHQLWDVQRRLRAARRRPAGVPA